LNQDYPHVEYIVVDGGSTDGTLDVLHRYREQLRWVSEPDGGQAEAINKGWRMARGEILAWLNSDDIYRPGAIRAAVDALQRHPDVGAIYGDCDYIAADGHFLERYETHSFDYLTFIRTARSPVPQPSTFLRRAVLESVGGLDETLHLALDWEYWLRAGARFPIVYVPQTLACYRVHGVSKSATHSLGYAVETVRVYRRMFADPELPVCTRVVQREAMNSVLFWAAHYAFSGAHLQVARRYLFASWRYRPLRFRRAMLKIFLVSFLGRRGWSAWMRFRRWRGAQLGVFEKLLGEASAT
jgi:glycosyltransferase involved in cell wall biosynthesis